MKIKKLTALAMTTAMCAATIFGCGGSDDKKETTTAPGATTQEGGETTTAAQEEALTAELKVWCPAEDQESGWMNKMLENFKAAHPTWNLTFTVETCSEGDAGKNVKQDPTVAGDVYFFANDQLIDLINSDGIAKLGGSTADYVKSTNSEKLVATVTQNGDIYGIPFTDNTWFMYYNKSIFTEDDVKNLDTMLSKAKVAFPLTNTWYFQAFYAAVGGVFCGANGDDEAAGIVLGDNAKAATKYIVNLVNNPNFVNDADGVGIAGLGDGSIGAFFSGTWDYQNVVKAIGEENVGICQLPTITVDGKDYTLKAFAGSKAIGVNPNCQNQKVAVALAQYLASEEAQLAHYEMRGIIPCNTTLLATEALQKDALAQAQANTVANTSINQPVNTTFNTYWWSVAGTMSTNIYNKEITLDNADAKTDEFQSALKGE
ncbi:MAG: extracellular solute-binding protein [Lachnospiraceae bacterium]|nr:extracellular solute-binding protein [Lachnospiraceae bacterium]